MVTADLVQVLVFFAVLFALVKPVGLYMARIYEGERTLGTPILGWLERGIYRLCGIDETQETGWKTYALQVMALSTLMMLGLYALLRCQHVLPFNPQGFAGLSPDLAFSTAVSFVTNTNWQSYGGESTMSYFSQMVGLTVQNFISTAVGMSVLVALVRGLARKETDKVGNFWVDMTRSLIYVLLPLALIWALLLASQGVVQTFDASINVQTVSGAGQTIAVGPVASQVAIKQLGTNGGGYFNVNSAHPLENPTALSNFLELLAILLIPAALCYTYGYMVRDRRQGWSLLAAMTIIFVPLFLTCAWLESGGNPHMAAMGIDQTAGNMEGKEERFGITQSALWATATTAASNGSVNSMHASYTPLGGLMPLMLMQFSEVIYGGVGSGLYGMLVYVLLAVFIAGLMVGRTPEYLGKKVQAFEIKMAALVMLAPLFATLGGAAIAVLLDAGRAGPLNSGAQGFAEILYAFTSAGNNNGSAFAGLTANTPFYNTALGLAMLIGRFLCLLPVLAIAGSFAQKKITPNSAGTLPTHTPLFIGLLVAVIVLVGVLTYAPSFALGPIAEHLGTVVQR